MHHAPWQPVAEITAVKTPRNQIYLALGGALTDAMPAKEPAANHAAAISRDSAYRNE